MEADGSAAREPRAKDPTPPTTTDPARAAVLFEQSVAIMARLRAPGGCPWDREQSFDSIRKYTLEEAYEVFDAIERRDFAHLCRRARRPASAGPFLCGDGGQRRPLHHRRCARSSEPEAGPAPSARFWRRGITRGGKQGRCGCIGGRLGGGGAAQLGRDQSRRKGHCMQQTRLRRKSNRTRASTMCCACCPHWLKRPSLAPKRRSPASTGRAGASCCPSSTKKLRS